MTYEERKRLAQKLSALVGNEPDSVIGFSLLTVIVHDLEKAGWKFVPVEPTAGMVGALTRNFNNVLGQRDMFVGTWVMGTFNDDYKAMLDKAPKVTE